MTAQKYDSMFFFFQIDGVCFTNHCICVCLPPICPANLQRAQRVRFISVLCHILYYPPPTNGQVLCGNKHTFIIRLQCPLPVLSKLYVQEALKSAIVLPINKKVTNHVALVRCVCVCTTLPCTQVLSLSQPCSLHPCPQTLGLKTHSVMPVF